MFGLMKSCTCLQTRDERRHRRLHYCGTCKTLGGLYGQKSRFFLNCDAVFLGELLSAISGTDGELDSWDRSYQSFSCLSIPSAEKMPLPIQFAATATIINAWFKIDDQIADSKRSFWCVPKWFCSRSFRAASARLNVWGFPLAELRKCLEIQAKREARAEEHSSGLSAQDLLALLAEQTGKAAGLFFKHGARVMGSQGAEGLMEALGKAFGSMIYLLDALEDYEKDHQEGNFNALRAAFGLSYPKLPASQREFVVRKIKEAASETQALLQELPISEECAARFIERLHTNLWIRLKGERRAGRRSCGSVPRQVIRFRERLGIAVEVGKSMALKSCKSDSPLFRRIKAPFVFAPASLAGFLLPNHARSATSLRECMEFSSNLMLLGSAFSPAFAVPIHSPALLGPTHGPGSGLPEGPELPLPENKRGWWSGCDCGGCDCCCDCGGGCCSDCNCCD